MPDKGVLFNDTPELTSFCLPANPITAPANDARLGIVLIVFKVIFPWVAKTCHQHRRIITLELVKVFVWSWNS